MCTILIPRVDRTIYRATDQPLPPEALSWVSSSRTALRSTTPAHGVNGLGVRAGREGYQLPVWVPFVLPPMLVLLAVVLQAIETRLLGNGPGRTRSAEQADVVIASGPIVSSASSASSG